MRRATKPRCKALIAYLIVQILAFSATFFIRNAIDVSTMGHSGGLYEGSALRDGKECEIVFLPDAARVMDCQRFDREERFEIAAYVDEFWRRMGLPHLRSVQSLEAELAFHVFSYRFGIEKERAVNADLNRDKDERWYVVASYNAIEALGL
jgi:hypothetical protein